MAKDDIQPVLVNADMGLCMVGYDEARYSYSLAPMVLSPVRMSGI
ncbi:MAG: hypothetical protein V3V23_06295 [Dehalococcoidales bacterium]